MACWFRVSPDERLNDLEAAAADDHGIAVVSVITLLVAADDEGQATCGRLHWGAGFLTTCAKRRRMRSGTVRTKRNALASRDGRWEPAARNVRGRTAQACLHTGGGLPDWRRSEGARSG